ncbi:MAG TPA: SdiA-regulated domain-containing protein [Acidobacteriota bacterium]|nr:SdiA-regulated domain-containing protein [Acidobacteriota bacterium]
MFIQTLLGLLIATVLAFWQDNAPLELELIRAFPVEGGTEPSGLTIRENRLFVVLDNDDKTIFELHLQESIAVLEPHIRFVAPPLEGVPKLDFEGITHDNRDFYLVSEATSRILRVSDDGQSEWLTPDLREEGRKKGLFQVHNGGLEGIAAASSRRFFLCAERQQRGIIDVRIEENGILTHVWNCEKREWADPYDRPPDFSDLYLEQNRLFALMRSDEGIAEMELKVKPGEDSARVRRFWSFGRTLHNPKYSYRDPTYGKAEGLCMDSSRIYLILDNNVDARSNDANDTRPLFFIFRRPPG